MNTTQNIAVTHRLDYIHRFIPAHAGRNDFSEDYSSYLPVEKQQDEIRESLHLYARGSLYVVIRLEGTVDEPSYVQVLNEFSLLFPETGPGPRHALHELHPCYETAIEFWHSAKPL